MQHAFSAIIWKFTAVFGGFEVFTTDRANPWPPSVTAQDKPHHRTIRYWSARKIAGRYRRSSPFHGKNQYTRDVRDRSRADRRPRGPGRRASCERRTLCATRRGGAHPPGTARP